MQAGEGTDRSMSTCKQERELTGVCQHASRTRGTDRSMSTCKQDEGTDRSMSTCKQERGTDRSVSTCKQERELTGVCQYASRRGN